jgi:hypothetical protein
MISGRDAPDVMFISAHRACCQKAGSKAGPLTSHAQQWTMSHVAGNPKPDPRKSFITDLIQFVKEQGSIKPLAINVNLDANKRMGEEARRLQKLTAELGLTDIQGNNLGAHNAPATNTRGSKQVDHGLACPLLLTHVIRRGFGARVP